MKKKLTFLIILVVLFAFTLAGAPYYLEPMAARVRSPLHPWFRSSGYLGQSAGILAFLGFAFLWLYPIRKRVRRLAVTGSVPRWLEVHIVVGLFLPWLVALHAGWRFGGLAGLAFGAMVVVWTSGLIGRYLYARIPRSRNGLELSREEIATRRRELVLRIAAVTAWAPEEVERFTSGSLATPARPRARGALAGMIADDFARRRALRALERRWRALDPEGAVVDENARREALRLARQEMTLAQQVRMLDVSRRIFRYWHVAHLPVGLTALLAVCVHVVVVIALGTTWFK